MVVPTRAAAVSWHQIAAPIAYRWKRYSSSCGRSQLDSYGHGRNIVYFNWSTSSGCASRQVCQFTGFAGLLSLLSPQFQLFRGQGIVRTW